jgi:D-threo-aldose 1-dehydrogenase
VPIGNEFEPITDDQADATLAAAWETGLRYFDVAPWYGLGLAERRYGRFLHRQKRDDYVLSTKVGKLLKATPDNRSREMFRFAPSPNNVVFDYSADGVRRSIEDSLQRIGVDRIDIAFVHDISADNPWLPCDWEEAFAVALKGAFPALSKMRDEGIIQAWGIGVNTPEPMLRVMREADPDICLLAKQYSLIDHEHALHEVMPVAREAGVRFVIGSSLHAGFVSGSARYNYGEKSWDIPREVTTKREKMQEIADLFGVDLRSAALQFSAAPDVAAALVTGMKSPAQVIANVASMAATIPSDFWATLKDQNLIAQDAAVPAEE